MMADATPMTPATCWHCGRLMTDLAVHPAGGPWICLTCKGETLEAARARHASSGAPSVVASGETTAATWPAEAAEDVDPASTTDTAHGTDVEDMADEEIPFSGGDAADG
jgi:hypothetical protein